MSSKLEKLEKVGLMPAKEEKCDERMPLGNANANAKRKADDNVSGEAKKARGNGVKGPGGVEIIDLT